MHCLARGFSSAPAAIATGYYTWWLNYLSRPMRPVDDQEEPFFDSYLHFCRSHCLADLGSASPVDGRARPNPIHLPYLCPLCSHRCHSYFADSSPSPRELTGTYAAEQGFTVGVRVWAIGRGEYYFLGGVLDAM